MRRWLFALGLPLAACRSGQPSDFAGYDDPRWGERSALLSDRALAGRRLGLSRILDSLAGALARVPAGATSTVVALDSIPPSDRLALEAKLAQIWPRARRGALRLVVVLYRPSPGDSARARGAFFEGSILPERIDGKTCVTVIARNLNWRGQVAELTRGPSSLLGPCVFEARFGPAGRGMARWLAGTDYEAIRSADWFFRPASSSSRFEMWYQPQEGEWLVPLMEAFAQRVTPYWSGPLVVGCLAGRVAACEEFVRGPARDSRGGPISPVSGVVLDGRQHYWDVEGRAAWVTDLIRREGEAAFGRFWRSDAELGAGFRAAYGKDLGTAVADWERHEWELVRGGPPVELGAPIRVATAAAGFGWGLLILLLPLVAARRRAWF